MLDARQGSNLRAALSAGIRVEHRPSCSFSAEEASFVRVQDLSYPPPLLLLSTTDL